MTQTLTGLFDQYDDARRAVQDLEATGVPHRDVSIVANNAAGTHAPNAVASEAGEDAGKGAGIGATVGGVGGLLAVSAFSLSRVLDLLSQPAGLRRPQSVRLAAPRSAAPQAASSGG